MNTKHDSAILLQQFLPNIYALINEVSKYDSNINASYERRYNYLKEEITQKGVYRQQTTIFDLLWDASDNIPKKKVFLTFIDDIVYKILSNIEKSKRSQVRKVCYQMITSFNKKESQYSRHLAELCVLEKIVTDPRFTLDQIEKKLPNGKKIDFVFRADSNSYYVEVYNIDFDIHRVESAELFQEFLIKRLEIKINSKVQSIPIEEYQFILVTVLSGEIKKIYEYSNVFTFFKEFRFLSPFMMISEYISVDDNCVYTFEPVISFLKRNQEIEAIKSAF